MTRNVLAWLGPLALLAAAAAGVWYFVYRENPAERIGRIMTEARRNLDMYEYSKAEALILDAIDIRPGLAVLHHDLAVVYVKQERLDEARAAFARAASLYEPAGNEARAAEYFEIAEIDVKQGRYAQAERAIELGIAAQPTHRLLHTRLIDLQLGLLKQPARADTSTRRFLRMCGPTAQNLLDAARVHIGRGSLLSGVTLAKKAAAREDTMLAAHLLVGNTYWRVGWPDTGLAYLEGPLERYPDVAPLWVIQGTLLIGAGRYDAALESLEHALELEPKSYEAYRARMMAYFNAERYEESLAEVSVCWGLTDNEDEQRFLRMHADRVRRAMAGTRPREKPTVKDGTPP